MTRLRRMGHRPDAGLGHICLPEQATARARPPTPVAERSEGVGVRGERARSGTRCRWLDGGGGADRGVVAGDQRPGLPGVGDARRRRGVGGARRPVATPVSPWPCAATPPATTRCTSGAGFVPPATRLAMAGWQDVGPGDRADLMAARALGDPTRSGSSATPTAPSTRPSSSSRAARCGWRCPRASRAREDARCVGTEAC